MTNEHNRLYTTDNMSIKIKELLSISSFCANPQHYISMISDAGERIILTRNGTPIAGLAPLWMLNLADEAARCKGRGICDSYSTCTCIGVTKPEPSGDPEGSATAPCDVIGSAD